MFLAMPVIAVMKILFDHSAHFRNWGVLLGDDRSPDPSFKNIQSPKNKSI